MMPFAQLFSWQKNNTLQEIGDNEYCQMHEHSVFHKKVESQWPLQVSEYMPWIHAMSIVHPSNIMYSLNFFKRHAYFYWWCIAQPEQQQHELVVIILNVHTCSTGISFWTHSKSANAHTHIKIYFVGLNLMCTSHVFGLGVLRLLWNWQIEKVHLFVMLLYNNWIQSKSLHASEIAVGVGDVLHIITIFK